MSTLQKKELIQLLRGYISENKNSLFDQILPQRTNYMTVVLENIFQPHNASAVLRSCDCFGVQNVHIIENDNTYNVNPAVALGATKWLQLNTYNQLENNTLACIQSLKKQGYRMVATTPHKNDCNLEEFDLSKGKFALMFGSEQPGLSEIALEQADEFVKIPMYGFTESFNISVSAALCMHHLSWKLRNSDIDWKLSEEEYTDVLLDWSKQVVKRSDIMEKEYLERLRNQ